MFGCCWCCSALRPRYKRLVDNIFPVNPQDGLVKNNMEKLTFYSLSSPEKLDRIGEYLFQRASRDIYRRRNGFVVIAMEAMDQLLVACHAQTLNLFVESFLKMIQKLLESTDPQLQILATQSLNKVLASSSLSGLPTSNKIRRLITHVTISLYQNTLQCATQTTTILQFANK